MSSSDDYHRHRLRTATKYFKVSLKPFQRLAECEAEPHEDRLGGARGGSPERTACGVWGRAPRKNKKCKQTHTGGRSASVNISNKRYFLLKLIIRQRELIGIIYPQQCVSYEQR